MRFTKMQGCGNDYIYVNAMEERVTVCNSKVEIFVQRHSIYVL